MAKLNNRQELFCLEYIIDLNATQAAIRAGYSEKTAYSIGQRLLKKVEVQERIQQLINKHASKVSITVEDVLQDLIDTKQQCQNRMTYIDAQGNERIDSAAVNGRTKNNELLGKYLTMFVDKIEHSGTIDVKNSELIDKYLKS